MPPLSSHQRCPFQLLRDAAGTAQMLPQTVFGGSLDITQHAAAARRCLTPPHAIAAHRYRKLLLPPPHPVLLAAAVVRRRLYVKDARR